MRRDLAWVAVLLAIIGGAGLGALGGCGNAPCARHSDCPTGLTCSVDSACIVAQDAADDGGAEGDGGGSDAAAALDATPDDASIDAPDDAGPDAPLDGGP